MNKYIITHQDMPIECRKTFPNRDGAFMWLRNQPESSDYALWRLAAWGDGFAKPKRPFTFPNSYTCIKPYGESV